ncbi:hypothetical protein E2C01_031031 [Portunus trituberculatus]|uniref:Uncharacterized protein n=1 Tax=Portunus trituberculatus TaxID=210409 RepID=A0A5B7EVS8_PORTR|nr:hypothetical protein [Portunus trituberculatus]
MVTPNPASESLSGEGTKNVPRPVVGPVLKQRQEGGETNFVVKKGEDISHWDNLIRSQRERGPAKSKEKKKPPPTWVLVFYIEEMRQPKLGSKCLDTSLLTKDKS